MVAVGCLALCQKLFASYKRKSNGYLRMVTQVIMEHQEAGATTTEYALTVTALAAIALTVLKLAFSSFWQQWLVKLASAVLVKAGSFSDLSHVFNYLRVW